VLSFLKPQKMKRVAVLASVPFLFALLLTSCRKDAVKNLTEDEARIYITNFDSTANFRNYVTYSIVDSVAVISNNRLTAREKTAYDQQVLNAIKTQMQQRGFTLVDKNSHPDLGINVSRITSTYTGVVSYPNYWNDYSSFYDPFYWGYGGYGYYSPYSYGVYQVKEGALSIDALDLKNTANNRINTVWSALARGTGVFRTQNAAPQVESLFHQSPYLKTNY
jgi:hypothetical protein